MEQFTAAAGKKGETTGGAGMPLLTAAYRQHCCGKRCGLHGWFKDIIYEHSSTSKVLEENLHQLG